MTPDANGSKIGPASNARNIVIKDPNRVLAGDSKVTHHKNIVKLNLHERDYSQKKHSASHTLKESRREAANQIGSSVDEKSDNAMDNTEAHDQVMQPVMDIQGIGVPLKPWTIREERDSTGERQMNELMASLEMPHRMAKIQVGKKMSDLSDMLVETQGIASHLNLNDAATSPIMPPTPNLATKEGTLGDCRDMMVRG